MIERGDIEILMARAIVREANVHIGLEAATEIANRDWPVQRDGAATERFLADLRAAGYEVRTIDTKVPYEELRDPERPWGYWLRRDEEDNELIDDNGLRWPSARIAFWSGRLGMPGCHDSMKQLDFLDQVLDATAQGEEPLSIMDRLFEGNEGYFRHYSHWLHGAGLARYDSRRWGTNVLTFEGVAVSRMLVEARGCEVAYRQESMVLVDCARRRVKEVVHGKMHVPTIPSVVPQRFLRDG